MSYAIKGLRVKPSYEQLVNVAVSDKLYNIKIPNRDSTFLRNGFLLSQLDGEGTRIMHKQQEMASTESYREQLLKEIAKTKTLVPICPSKEMIHIKKCEQTELRRQCILIFPKMMMCL